jgi:hypothetical protein
MRRAWGAALIAVGLAAAFAGGVLVGRDQAPSRVKAAAPAEPLSQPVRIRANPLGWPVETRGSDPHDLDLGQLVPREAVIDGVWFVPAGRTVPRVAIAWHRVLPPSVSLGRNIRPVWNLTLWSPSKRGPTTRWVAYRLIVGSPYPIADWDGNSGVRLADVTGDGHADLLVSVGIKGSNHGATLLSVFATVDGKVRRIYGFDSVEDKSGLTAYGRNVIETQWGARKGLLWFREPGPSQSVCCPDYYLRYELRWNGHGWDRVSEQRIHPNYG